MITKISKLRDFGIFQDFNWDKDLSDFKRYNLIFGLNRSGKTSISRIFASCEKKCTYDVEKFKRYPVPGEFELKTLTGDTIKSSEVSKCTIPVKVFNRDFVEDNISFDSSNSCNPIVYISEEDIESKTKLDKLKAERPSLEEKLRTAQKSKSQKDETKSSFLIGLGREVANVLFDKTYNKVKVEKKINSIGAENFKEQLLTEENKKKFEEISRESYTKISEIDFPSFKIQTLETLSEIYLRIKDLLNVKIVSEVLDRLKEDLELNKWIREGYDLHMSRTEFDHCLFCQNQITFSLLDRFSKHYSPEYRDLQKTIDTLVSELKKLKITNVYISYADFYPDLRNNCKNLSEKINNIVVKIIDWRDSVTDVLLQKSNNPFESDLEIILEDPGNLQNELENSLKELNQLIITHNKSIAEHPKRVIEAKEKLEIHTIATALSEQDFPKMVKDLEEAIRVEQEASLALENLEKEMMPLESKTSNIGVAIKEINQHIKDFFGKQEIVLQLDSLKKGYTIKRNGIPATNLSEGEKTAIAFSYFIVKVKENDNKIKDTILFIDDPMSSLDTNFIYHCFALITIQFQEALQLFISTHNFQFFNLVKEWYIKKNNQIKKDNQKLLSAGRPAKSLSCEFYMIENYTDKDKRKGKLTELDKTLREYKSEYHFLFAQLNRFKDADLTYADCYTIGNIARRFFDIYADFKIPDHRDQKQKMEAIVKSVNASGEKIGQVEYNKAYKLINEFSHNSDPTSTIEHKDKTECKDAINTILKIVQESDNKHYQILEESLHD